MEKTSKKQMLQPSEKELEKYIKEVENEWGMYMFYYRIWQKEVQNIRKNYNGFGMELPYICVEIDVLFKSFIEVEMKKTKNKKYQKFLMELLEVE